MKTICMKCQILFSKKNKKNIMNLSSAKSAQRVTQVKIYTPLYSYFQYMHILLGNFITYAIVQKGI